MKFIFWVLLIFNFPALRASECHPPGQGFLETRLKETFHVDLAQTELKEWMIHSSNLEVRQNLKDIDRRIKLHPQRLAREELLEQSQQKFEQAIANTGRPVVMENFPTSGNTSKVSGAKGALSIEMDNLKKDELDLIPKEILDKIAPKIRVNYFFPYDKYEYFLTYNGEELPMESALLKVQKEMEYACEKRVLDNAEFRLWYKRNHGVEIKRARGE